jgi:deoxyribodipyrimidine photo-lyase
VLIRADRGANGTLVPSPDRRLDGEVTISPTIVWFRQDLRLQDNPALAAALTRGEPVIAIYVLDDAGEGRWPAGGASRWWLHHSLAALDGSLRLVGSQLHFYRGDSADIIRQVIRDTGAGAVYWNRRYEPAVRQRDSELKTALTTSRIYAASFNGSLLHEPHTVRNQAGKPFLVFTAYWRQVLTMPVDAPVTIDLSQLKQPATWPDALPLDALELLPRKSWGDGFAATGTPGEMGAQLRLEEFAAHVVADYATARDFPDTDGTSMLSPALHFGELSPRQVWAAVRGATPDALGGGAEVYLKELGWREFSYSMLYHYPHTAEEPLRGSFARFRWAEDSGGGLLRAWQRGQTGYPIVDAGMRQLWATGWMHNRVRMIVASFLVKHLRLNWTAGAAWFWDTLVDADLANNTMGWQWSAGSGADAAPYFRIFSPQRQGEKFDANGDYVRRWVPELAALPSKYVHAPSEAPDAVLAAAGVILGTTYPRPIVDHVAARKAAMAAYGEMLGQS